MAGPKLKQWAWGAYTADASSSESGGASPVMAKPKNGQFLCIDCKFLSDDKKRCGSSKYRALMGTDVLPRPADEMCSNFFEPASGEDLALAPVAPKPPTK